MLVRIEVLDANDNSPEFINLPSRLSVEENLVESGLYQLQAIDRDSGNFGMVKFSIEGADGAMIVDSKVGMTSSVRRIFERGGPENLRIMKTRMKIFQPKSKFVFLLKIR